jgi:RHS repeat-associated protein
MNNYDVTPIPTIDNQMQNGQHIYAYDYDKVGNRMTMSVTHNNEQAETHAYTYDAIYQITGVDYPSGFDENLATDTTFNYDAAGNRTSVIDGSGTCTYTTNSLNQYTAAGTTSYQYDDSGNMVHDENYAYGYDPENRLVKVRKSGPYGTLTLGDAMESPLTYTTGGDGNWTAANGGEGHDDMSAAHSPSLAQDEQSWMQTEVQGPGTISFWAKINPADAGNELKFYVDDTLRYSCDSEEWEDFSWEVTGAGTHTLKWVYARSSETSSSTGYVDDVGWTGALPAVPPPEPAATNWRYLEYTYDASGRRIEKKYDYETVTKYVYDGDDCIAEYNAYNQLKRKYIYGPGVDQPICMIDTMTSPAVMSYYHFDALGSVVALTNSSGNTVEVYEYDVYGRVGASDASHPNRIMFTGREYDKETGLYYYRARYYNPQIGRFLQTDPIGYRDSMNLYRCCRNNPVGFDDPWGSEEQRKLAPGYWREWNFASGRVLVLPWRLDPGMLQMCEAFSEYMKNAKDVFDKITPDLPVAKEVMKKYMEALEKVSGLLPGIVGNDKNAWKAFIEVEVWEETADKDGKPHLERISTDNWVEVVNLAGWDNTMSAYPKYEDAVKAAQTGIMWYNISMNSSTRPPLGLFYDGKPDAMFWGNYVYKGDAPYITQYLNPETKQPLPQPN